MAKKIFAFYSNYSDSRIDRFRQETKKKNIEFKSYNFNKDLMMTERGLIKIKNNQTINLDKDYFCWIFSNSMLSHYFEKLYAKNANFVWPSRAVADFSDKMYTNHFFKTINVKTPKTILLSQNEETLLLKVNYVGGFPCIIKKVFGTGGVEVGIVNSLDDLKFFVKNFYQKKFNKNFSPFLRASFALQEYIKNTNGNDYRVLCLDGKIIGGIKRISQNGDFRANISLGGKAENLPIDEKLKKICQKILRKRNFFYAGIDFIKKDTEYLAIEINTSAQFQGFEQATGINVAKKIIETMISK